MNCKYILEVIKIEYLKKYLTNPIVLFIIIVFLVFTNVISLGYFLYFQEEEKCICPECPMQEEEEKIEIATIVVDIKGYVKNPGVYKLEEGSIVNDLIVLAGGVKSGGTTDNINLSQKLNNEDMIVILSKSELTKIKNASTSTTSTVSTSTSTSHTTSTSEVSETLDSTNLVKDDKISLNTATKEELMTLSGIGEAKALSIIEYRSVTPFKDISEIKNISGIGDSIYEKIKDHITI